MELIFIFTIYNKVIKNLVFCICERLEELGVLGFGFSESESESAIAPFVNQFV